MSLKTPVRPLSYHGVLDTVREVFWRFEPSHLIDSYVHRAHSHTTGFLAFHELKNSCASTRLPRAFGHFMSLKTPLRPLSNYGFWTFN